MSFNYSEPPFCCSKASTELKLYQTFIFSIPICFTFILFFLFYVFYLRQRRVDWTSLRMRMPSPNRGALSRMSESGLKKELREMLPIVVFKESFSIRDSQCSVCLGDYEAEDKLQQIPACGHTFHMNCIDHWLATHTTCPLCRISLLPSAKTVSDQPDNQPEAQADNTQTNQGILEVRNGDESSLQRRPVGGGVRDNGASHCVADEEEHFNTRKEFEVCGDSGEGSVVVIDVEIHFSVEQEALREHL